MTENLHTALTVMAVGMVTVFTILSLVVLTGKLLISAVNKFAPAPESLKKRSTKSLSKTLAGKEKETIAALVAAVEAVTGGKGKITSIEKVK